MSSDWINQEPKALWEAFKTITEIPHGSGNETAILKYIESEAQKLGFEYESDSAHNLVVRKPGAKGREKAPIVVFQCHVDMVCEKNRDTKHDFLKDPLDVYQEGDWLKARGTTLGADNGIAVASALCLMKDSTVKHGPLEFLFTTEEETGLVGATNLSDSILKGRILINMDSEEEGILYVGCAGGNIASGILPISWVDAPSDLVPVQIKVTGLKGGHSGADIHLPLGNANEIGVRALWYLAQDLSYDLAHLEGGDKHNAIPREFFATILVATESIPQVRSFIDEYESTIRNELGDLESSFKMDVQILDVIPQKVFLKSDATKLINLLFCLPNGVVSRSKEIPGLIETSTNFAAIKIDGSNVSVLSSQRSSVMSRRDHVADRIKTAFLSAGGTYKIENQYPAWEPDWNSRLSKIFGEAFEVLEGKKAEISVIHAGLECGIIGSKYEGMEMISFGPDLVGVHTPEEKLSVSSTVRSYKLLNYVLEKL
ncbi:aminoacyl-histidine dipeptidase [Spirochaeta cellobiosiphila]|uniref:aminoacyl-histidine dipeptidase n=1 Tax=Spirochaeta cellobiosiphila TaxID=504483 RepID=UPI00041EF109|nr:aminoacyl-histidine dipeptidase [Spirochaeta cellobiosiphila]